ncbi:MAG: hypothetical protein ABIK28_13360 [Planctomycetota bacterium]
MFPSSFFRVFLWPCLLACVSVACSRDDAVDSGKGIPGHPAIPVAQIALDGGGLTVRNPGNEDFAPWDGVSSIGQGATLKSGDGIVSMNFMGCVEVQLSQKSELILEGLVQGMAGPLLVLALKEGEVRINSSADYPIRLKMPPGEVTGIRSFFTATLRNTEDGGYSGTIKALSPNVEVKNEFGSLMLDSWGWVKVQESGPPQLLKDLKQPHGVR